MLCSLLSMTEVIMLEITSSLQKSSRKLKRSMAVLAHVAVLRETSYETSSGGRRPRVLERLSALKLHTDSFFVEHGRATGGVGWVCRDERRRSRSDALSLGKRAC